MIKSKTLDIKFIFKTFLKLLKIGEKHFWFPNGFLFHENQRIILKNYS